MNSLRLQRQDAMPRNGRGIRSVTPRTAGPGPCNAKRAAVSESVRRAAETAMPAMFPGLQVTFRVSATPGPNAAIL